MTGNAHQFQRAMPVLPISDMDRSLAFYKDKLGFSAATWGEPSTFAILQRGTVTLALAVVATEQIVRTGVWSAYLYVADADEVHAELMAHSVAISGPPQTRFYGCRDFTIDDPDGHGIGIGQVLDPGPLGPGLSDRVGRDGNAR